MLADNDDGAVGADDGRVTFPGATEPGRSTPAAASAAELVASGFFAWRTPLLPLAEAVSLSDGLQAPTAAPDDLAEALDRDRALVRGRLRELCARPEVREAVFVGSPDLESTLDGDTGDRAEGAQLRYATRMATRPTPFGLFAGCSVGKTGGHSALRLAPRHGYRRQTRLDMGYLTALTDALVADPEVRAELPVLPNSSLYRAHGRVRYVETRWQGATRTSHLVAVPLSDSLVAALARAENGATPAEVADAVAGTGVDRVRSEGYVDRLLDRQLLVPDLGVAITGPDPLEPVLRVLRAAPTTKKAAEALDRVVEALAVLDGGGLGADPARYRELARDLDGLPATPEPGRLFQVDMVKPATDARLSEAVIAEITRAVRVLHRLARPPGRTELDRFTETFTRRYEGQEIPLVEALDEEAGVGFGGTDPAPLLRGLAFPTRPEERAPWGRREQHLLTRLLSCTTDRRSELVLTRADLDTLAGDEDPPPLPDALAVTATLVAAGPAALAEDRFSVLIRGAAGPSGARLLGRFCPADPALTAHVRDHLRAEEAAAPDAVFAEIVHLPEGRMGNVLARPVLRDHEIAYLGRSGAPPEARLPADDLLVSVRGGRITLRSARLGRRVIPRMTNAHNFGWRSQPVYRFLCALQSHGRAAHLGWTWGPLGVAPFLPRVRHGRLVLALARWRVTREELQRLGAATGSARYTEVQGWRADRGLPRRVELVDGDNRLLVDFDNALSVDSFVTLVRRRTEAILEELYPGPDQLCAEGPEGRFTHELVVPFTVSRAPKRADTRQPAPQSRRRYPPGDRWLYAALYCGPTIADAALHDVLGPLANRLLTEGRAERWFFLRYGDPDHHLRVRFAGDPESLQRTVLPALTRAVTPLVDDGRIWRVVTDTYVPEIERYGGPAALRLAERVFHADSEAVVAILGRLSPGDAGRTERWQLALHGMDGLLSGLGFDLPGKLAIVRRLRDGYATEHHLDGAARRPIGARFREQQPDLAALLGPVWPDGHPLVPGFEALARLRAAAESIAPRLRALDAAGELTLPLDELAPSYLHMHANRLLRASQRRQEAVLYDFLTRLYEQRQHRDRRTGKP
ncbi:MAG: lantibiotic dehydratase [Pseudonocardia sp.]|nr:lantibiotic dehydratase [Pseudonocardia sp.]